MTRTQKIKHNQILKLVKAIEGRKDCLKAYQILLRELRTFELRIKRTASAHSAACGRKRI